MNDHGERTLQIPRELRAFRHGWINLIGLLVSVALILAFFTPSTATESPPFP